MAKKKKPQKDRHKRRLQVALSPKMHALMQALAKKNVRPLRHEVHLALLEHLRKAGVTVPKEVAENI